MNQGSFAKGGSKKLRQMCARVSRPTTVPVVMMGFHKVRLSV